MVGKMMKWQRRLKGKNGGSAKKTKQNITHKKWNSKMTRLILIIVKGRLKQVPGRY